MKLKPKPAATTPAPEPAAQEEPMPQEAASEADATLPDLPSPEPQQAKAGAGGEEQVEAPDAAPADGIGAQQPPLEEAAGTSSPGEPLMAGPGPPQHHSTSTAHPTTRPAATLPVTPSQGPGRRPGREAEVPLRPPPAAPAAGCRRRPGLRPPRSPPGAGNAQAAARRPSRSVPAAQAAAPCPGHWAQAPPKPPPRPPAAPAAGRRRRPVCRSPPRPPGAAAQAAARHPGRQAQPRRPPPRPLSPLPIILIYGINKWIWLASSSSSSCCCCCWRYSILKLWRRQRYNPNIKCYPYYYSEWYAIVKC
ncbi:vegetative cell wall protein gp1-like [Panicum hallii]|uniref:vegetative cell wall protein gp1-like n=1 Tax=Panicum hallii TaxID=206008 RepID=UPI000DF4D6C1|nr:vegetative cell wall protein gp1-like [Panicum hallii]